MPYSDNLKVLQNGGGSDQARGGGDRYSDIYKCFYCGEIVDIDEKCPECEEDNVEINP